MFLIAYCENRNVLLYQDLISGFRWYLLVCFVFSAFEDQKMSRNGLKLSKYVRKWCFLSHTPRIETFYSLRFDKWVSWVPTSLFMIICIRKPKNVSKWVEIVKIR